MKINKKKLFVVALAVCLVAILSMGTLAWFTDNDSATNKFYVANSNSTDPEDIFSVDVQEIVDGETDPVEGYTFNNIIPNETLKKNPFVTNTGSYSQYVRATVTISDYAVFCAAIGADYPLETVFNDINPDWVFDGKSVDAAADTVSYVFYLNHALVPNASSELFKSVTIPKELVKEDFAAPSTLSDGFEIKVFAEAVQSENTADNAKDAFDLVDDIQPIA